MGNRTRLKLRLIGYLREHLPPGGDYDTIEIDVQEGDTICAITDRIGLSAEVEFFAMLDGEHVPEEDYASTQLAEAKELLLCPPLKGG